MSNVDGAGSPQCPLCKKRAATVPVTVTVESTGESGTAMVCRKCALDIAMGK